MRVGANEPSTEHVLSHPLFAELKKLLISVTGLAYYSDKNDELADRIRARMARSGILDCASYLDRLQEGTGPGSEMDGLVTDLTVGETHFFRHGEQLDAIRNVVLPELLERNRDRKRLRLWSAGCATGPEPYTLAIVLRRELGLHLRGWEVSIVGTDINRKSLAQAREARYGSWALRSMPEDVRESCFHQEGKVWILRPEFREWVSFQYHNLVQSSLTWRLDGLLAFDLILCRNVLIYFDGETSRSVIGRFHGALAEGGWLVLGEVENRPELFSDFRPVRAHGARFYRRLPPEAEAPTWTAARERSAAPAPSLSVQPAPPEAPPVPRELAPNLSPPRPRRGAPAEVSLDDVRRLADRGELDEAERRCGRLLERDGLDPLGHFYMALVREQMGKRDLAAESFRKAIYLDRSLVLAHYQLGIVLQQAGNLEGARKSFENVLELVSRRKPEELIEGVDDPLTAGELGELAGQQRRALAMDP